MILSDNNRKIFVEKSIFMMINQKSNLELKENILRLFNDTHKEFLKQFGLPTNDNIVFLTNQRGYNGKYDTRHKVIYINPKTIQGNNFQYFHTLIHESTHLIQDFVVKNNISRNNINELTLEQYQNMCQKFFQNKDIQISEEMLNNFKNFVNQNKYFENEKLNLIYKDLLTYKNFAVSYNNNVCEIMANEFALKELKDVFLSNKHELSQQYINYLKECTARDLKKMDKIEPNLKDTSLFIQKITSLFQNLSLNIRLHGAGLYDFDVDNQANMEEVLDGIIETYDDVDAMCYYNDEENKQLLAERELFDSLDKNLPNIETKTTEENNDHDEL